MKLRNSKLISIIVLTAICIQFRTAVASTELQLIGESYQKLLVFYEGNNDILLSNDYTPYHAERLMRLWEGFRQASDTIGDLTEPLGRRLTLNDVTVLVPAHLAQELAPFYPEILRVRPRPATWQRQDRADFSITSHLTEANEGPRWALSRCGEPPLKIELADESLDSSKMHKLGRRLALYFSQYRWGLRSEAPREHLTYPVVHVDGSVHWRVASCSQTLKKELRIASCISKGQPCDLNNQGLPLHNYTIEVTEPADSNAASFLFAPYSPGVTRFCESAKLGLDHNLLHNKWVDNDYNKHCGNIGAADIVRRHKDFQQTGSPEPAKNVKRSNFRFEVVFEYEFARVVVVMDTSMHMKGTRITEMIGAVTQFLAHVLNDGSQVALVNFNERAHVLQPLVKIDSPDVRKRLMRSVVSLTAGGGSCIGGAVQEAMKLLGADPASPSRRATGTIILLSDGQESCPDELSTSISALAHTSLRVYTISFGKRADKRISELSEVTHGNLVFLLDGASGSKAMDAFMALVDIHSVLVTSSSSETVIIKQMKNVTPFFRLPVTFNIDAGIRRNLAVTLYFPDAPNQVSRLRLMVRSPSGKTFYCTGSSDGISTVDPKAGTLTVRIPDADIEVGRWTLTNLAALGGRRQRQAAGFGALVISGAVGRWTLTNLAERRKRQAAGLDVIDNATTTVPSVAKAGLHKLPVVLDGSVSPAKVPNVTELSEINVFAKLTIGINGGSICNASMFAIISSGSENVARFDLFLFESNLNCYFGAKVPPHAVKSARQYTVTIKSTFPVERVKNIGTLMVDAENPHFNSLLTPPDGIYTTTVNIDIDSRILVSWKAVEDRSGLLSPGSPVPYYIVRYANSMAEMVTNFEELLATNQTFVDVFDKIQAIGIPRIFVAVVGVSAANVTGKVGRSRIIQLKTTAQVSKSRDLYAYLHGKNGATVSTAKSSMSNPAEKIAQPSASVQPLIRLPNSSHGLNACGAIDGL